MRRSMVARSLVVALTSVGAIAAVEPVAAQRADSAAYVVRFGTDTLALERWVRTADRLEAESVTRSPTTQVRRWTAHFDGEGRVMRVTTGAGMNDVEPAGAVPMAAGFYAPQVLAILEASRMRDTLAVVPTVIAGGNPSQMRVRRAGPDIFEVLNSAGVATTRAHVLPDGTLLFLETGGSTTVSLVPWFDLSAYAAEFAARDSRGQAMGMLSTRDTVGITVGGAMVRVDYGRPAVRGRSIFGGLVPWGRTWRAGADDPTQLMVDRAVRVGDVHLEPGSYAVYVIPERDRWTLAISRGTGMAVAMTPDAAQDVGRVAMAVRPLSAHVERLTIRLEPAAEGAVLRIQWERTEASVPIVPSAGR
jgi:hypothetical protein